jgi:DeoR/GlpR family transcriptional regulator of sugar metabolism
MLKSARQTQIRNLVEANGHVTVTELNRLLDVSEATIRRDLETLEQSGWVRRTHGGAVSIEPASKEPPIFHRQSEYLVEKQRIGRQAATLVGEGETIYLGSGSTVHEVAINIRDVPGLTVITNALNVINELVECDNIELIVIGGMFRQSELSMVGHIAEQAIREFRADKAIMGMRGIDAVHGFTSDYMPEAVTDRAILSIAPCNIVVADRSKLGRVSSVFLAPITSAHVLIIDQATPPDIVSQFRELGLEVQLA